MELEKDCHDSCKLPRIPGSIGSTVSGGVLAVTIAAPYITPQGHQEVLLLLSNVPNLAPAGTAQISIIDGPVATPYVFADENGYNVRADRLYLKARWLGAEQILPVRVVKASDPDRIVCLSYLPRSAYNGENAVI